ncbi:MAG: type IX secretion system membrane protein PorP/SprF, partial [Chitinophagales bacterium]|nr:type IX secretion system membrane protein PorP/SprF [Chitinophagales bacterium]
PTNKTQFGLQYAYRMHTSAGIFAIGIDASATNYHLNYQQLTAYIDGDPAFTNQPENTWSPNIGAGAWFNSDRFYAGASSPVLITDTISAVSGSEISQLNIFEAHRHYFVTAGVLIGNMDNIAVKPYTLIKYATGSPVQADINISLIFKNSVWLGGGYRTDNSMSLMAQYFVDRSNMLRKNTFGIGYAYNFSFEEVQDFFGPTHEIFIAYTFDKHTTRYTNPRFF